MSRPLLLCAAIAALGACQATPGTVRAEPLDPFIVGIDAGRWSVILDHATEGAYEADYADPKMAESELLRIDASLKTGAADLLRLRNEVCKRGLVKAETCVLHNWPAWTLEPPTAKVSLEELDRRSQWLGDVMSPFTDAGCGAGKKASGDELFCSVE